MKKVYIVLISLFVLVTTIGCGQLDNTPNRKVEHFFNKYQTLDVSVLNDLDQIINTETRLNTAQKSKYRDIMKKHYQNLSYKILEHEINGDDATVKVEITVTDLSKVLEDAEIYRENHPEEFNNELGEYDDSKYMDYRLERLKDAKEKVKYTLELGLTKTNNEWTLNTVSSNDLDKINGTYSL